MTAILCETEIIVQTEPPSVDECQESSITANAGVQYSIGSIGQIPPGEGRRFRVRGHEFAVFLTRQGLVHATQADCPHRNGPLSDGLLGGSQLICPLHAWKWDLSTGKPLFGDCALTVYPVRVTSEGEIWVELPH